jgi:CubicO group peptidase (beta-lactamase class C family)
VNGTVAAGYEPVRDQFAAVVAAEPGLGAQLAVYRHGRLVVDLSAGMAPDALTALYSTAKGAAHLVVAWLVQDGVLDLDRTVSSYWPRFTGAGKEDLTLRELLAHRSGVIGVDGGLRTRGVGRRPGAGRPARISAAVLAARPRLRLPRVRHRRPDR